MGGINHQPTKKIFMFSTMLSQYFSGYLAKLMLANWQLEEALLAELNGAPPTRVTFFIDRVKVEFDDALRLLENSVSAVDQLVDRMKELGYADTSRSTVNDYNELGESLIRNGLIPGSRGTWETISRVRRERAFFGICDLFKEQFQNLLLLSQEVSMTLNQAREHAEKGKLIRAIDENAVPFRPSFFKLLTNTINTLIMFTQSSAMSTEMYYREEGYGTLLSEHLVALATTVLS